MPKVRGFTLSARSARAFTLIELLVVISIIALLSSIGLVYYSSFLKSSRDSKRQSDLKVVQSVLEEYRTDQLYYPCVGTGTDALTFNAAFTSSIGNCLATEPSAVKTYQNLLPAEPISTRTQYSYGAFASVAGGACNNTTTKCGYYCIYASMENTSNTVTGTPCTFSGSLNYVITPP